MRSVSPFRWRRRVAMRDVDAAGVVWYGNYLVYCDEARAELLRAFGLAPSTIAAHGLFPAVVETHTRYLKPARLDDELEVRVQASQVRGARLVFDFEISRPADAAVLCRVQTVHALVRTSGELVYLIPEEFRSSVARMLAAQEAAQAEARLASRQATDETPRQPVHADVPSLASGAAAPRSTDES